ncbi:MAG: sterol desaturase family protein [Verrucomicrobiota bacterium]|nr:sterol desaturase family protein [Verrucomicrobiota bacterium]
MDFGPTSFEKLRLLTGAASLSLLLIWETLAPASKWFSQPRQRISHAARNYIIGLFNVFLVTFIFVQSWIFAANWASANQFGLLYQTSLPPLLRWTIALLLLDLWMYFWHRMNHTLSFFWRFHRMHHGDRNMDVTSAVRFHAGEIAFSALLRIPLILILGLRFEELALYELLLFIVVQFHHANVRLNSNIDQWLRLLIATPAFHRLHHSEDLIQTNSNYSSILSIWDRLFRTVGAGTPATLGVKGLENETLLSMLQTPFQKKSPPMNGKESGR